MSFALCWAALALFVTPWAAADIFPPNWPGAGRKESPDYPLFSAPLPMPPVIEPKYTINTNGTPLAYYEITIDAFQEHIYPDLGPANLVGYNSQAPGPTFRVPYGTESVVRVTNNVDAGAVVHLHGAWSRSPWDGWASEMINKGQFKDYYYSGSQSARTLWYHDHANHHTATDAYYGQMGFHIIYDPAEDVFNLPKDGYDIPLALEDKIYQPNGDLISPENEHINFFGDAIHVNGRPWPYFDVEPRKYRLRWLNAGLSRPYNLFIMDDKGAWQDMDIISSDGGLFGAPVRTQSLQISNGERYDLVFDFAPFAGSNVTVGNDMRLGDVHEYDNTNKVLRFVVGQHVSDASANAVPATLVDQSTRVQEPPGREHVDHVFGFARSGDKWTINGADFDDPAARVLARPPAGTVERWTLRYAGGPGVHPVHLHLVDFVVAARRGGSRGVLPYESAGLKDVVLLQPGEEVDVVARYGPWDGMYMFHCHNLVHEDAEMMDVMNVTFLEALGYAYKDVFAFTDPLDPRFVPRDVKPELFEQKYITETLLPSFAQLKAYEKAAELVKAENDYYEKVGYNGDASDAPPASTSSSATTTSRESSAADALSSVGGRVGSSLSSLQRNNAVESPTTVVSSTIDSAKAPSSPTARPAVPQLTTPPPLVTAGDGPTVMGSSSTLATSTRMVSASTARETPSLPQDTAVAVQPPLTLGLSWWAALFADSNRSTCAWGPWACWLG